MIRQRYRVRFRKQDDLRWISHRDLVRAFERLARRAELPLSMSEGFHPKPRLSFPSALALGIQGQDELVELELAEAMDSDELLARLRRETLPGLVIEQVQLVPEGQKKAQAVFQEFEFPVPDQRVAAVREAIQRLLARESVVVSREDRSGARREGGDQRDIRPGIEQLELEGGRLRMRLAMNRQANVHPRDLLRLLGLDDLERDGAFLTRTMVEVVP